MKPEGRGPFVTVDACIDVGGKVVLIERAHAPVGYALPGGFVDPGETVAAAAIREAKEETGLDILLVAQLFTYSDPRRDPRQHTISTAFAATAQGVPAGGDDAATAALFTEDEVPWDRLVFDHAEILRDYFAWKRTGRHRRL